ncbi:putative inactive purple acid phosphatase 27 [Ranunculus cassubicifolius]
MFEISPIFLISKISGHSSEWVTVRFSYPNPSKDGWIGVFSPANFSATSCAPENPKETAPLLCTTPIKYQYANYSSGDYTKTGKGFLKLQLINQRADFSFALFSGGLTKGSAIYAEGPNRAQTRSPAGTLTFSRSSMCGAPARTVGWRDPGFIHTSFLKELYTYKLRHILSNGTYVWSRSYNFKASPYPGQDSQQRVVIFGDMGKAEADGSNEYNNYQLGSLNTTKQIIQDLKNIDIVFHIGDICYANGYLSQWDQFTSQVYPITSTVPYMVASGNHERDWPGTGSFYGNMDSGGECGVPAEIMYYIPATNRAKPWYSTDYGMFHFCIADTEHDWREGTEQYKFIEKCLASVDRQKQPWLVFLAHRVLGYSSGSFYAEQGSFEEPMGRESLQKLWQKYKVDLAVYGHVHNYERTCPIYETQLEDEDSTLFHSGMDTKIFDSQIIKNPCYQNFNRNFVSRGVKILRETNFLS